LKNNRSGVAVSSNNVKAARIELLVPALDTFWRMLLIGSVKSLFGVLWN